MKRFYTAVTCAAQAAGGWQVLLDAKPVKTPAGVPLLASTPLLAEAIAQEWQAQLTTITPHFMPLTQLHCTLQDKQAEQLQGWKEQIHAYLDGDGLVYRCPAPEAMRAAQDQHWQPLRTKFEQTFTSTLELTDSIVPITQPLPLHEAVERVLIAASPAFVLTWQVAASELGSSILGWHVVAQPTPIEEILEAALVEDLFNDRLASPDGSNMDPMLEKRLQALTREIKAARLLAQHS